MPDTKSIEPAADGELLVDFAAAVNKPSIIKVIGVGGGGGNAVAHMYQQGIHNVSFLVTNTDSKALGDSPVPDHLQLGPGLGAGGVPERGREYAEASIDDIRKKLDDGTRMVFITAGMGGGTGTGAAPVIARESKAKGILTVGIVTIPFRFEGNVRIDKALDGVDEIAKEVDALLVINNERLREIYHDKSVTEAFAHADDTLSIAVRSIVDIITMHGRINLDFRDVDTFLRDGGVAIMSSAEAEGENRITRAIEAAINSPLLNDNDVYHARKMLLSIWHSGQQDSELMISEFDEINDFMEKFDPDIETKYGLSTDPSLGNKVKVTILASGFKVWHADTSPAPDENDDEDDNEQAALRRQRHQQMREKAYGPVRKRHNARHYKVCLIPLDDLDNEDYVGLMERTPTAHRKRSDLDDLQAATRSKAPAPDAPQPAGTDTITFSPADNEP